MKRLSCIAACCAAVGLLGAGAAWAQEIGPESFATGFEPAAGYVAGNPVPGQPGAWPEQWYSWYGTEKAVISTAQVHNGTQAVEYPGTNYTEIQHIGMANGDPTVYPPVTWQDQFSVYVTWEVLDGMGALRAEPWNNYPAQGYSYQLFLFRVDDGLTDGWYPQVGWPPIENDLRDEMGMDPVFDSFETNKWWTVTIVADGATATVTSVTISDDAGSTYTADNLSEPFSTWGTPLLPGERAELPERVAYSSEGGLVYLDDVDVSVVGGDLCGDANCDGVFNGADIDAFFLALGDPALWAATYPNCDIVATCDINYDLAVNGADIDPFFTALGVGHCP